MIDTRDGHWEPLGSAATDEERKYIVTTTIQLVAYGYDEHRVRESVERILDGIGAHVYPDMGMTVDLGEE